MLPTISGCGLSIDEIRYPVREFVAVDMNLLNIGAFPAVLDREALDGYGRFEYSLCRIEMPDRRILIEIVKVWKGRGNYREAGGLRHD